MKPRIGITSDGPRRLPNYQASVEHAGGEVQPLFPDTISSDPLQGLDGVLLTGGGDVDASEFHDLNHPKVHFVNRARDRMELQLTRKALQRGLPVFGICRGMQVMNIALGGNLIQDIPEEIRTLLNHDPGRSRHAIAHEVSIQKGTQLHRILGKDRVGVNSIHHQAVKDLGKGLIATAWSDDGIIEGLELVTGSYYLGVQWHPEEYVHQGGEFHSLFASFVEASGNYNATTRRR